MIDGNMDRAPYEPSEEISSNGSETEEIPIHDKVKKNIVNESLANQNKKRLRRKLKEGEYLAKLKPQTTSRFNLFNDEPATPKQEKQDADLELQEKRDEHILNYFREFPNIHQSLENTRTISIKKLIDINEELRAQVMQLRQSISDVINEDILKIVIPGYGDIQNINEDELTSILQKEPISNYVVRLIVERLLTLSLHIEVNENEISDREANKPNRK